MMRNWKYIGCAASLALIATVTGCKQSDYTQLVKSEFEKGIRQDSVLLGISFGASRNDFYNACLELNQRHLVVAGPGNGSVLYTFTDSVFHPEPTSINLLFTPIYDETDKIAQMNLEFSYLSWAPWNKQYQSDSLKGKVIQLLNDWYQGNDFIIAKVDNKDTPVKLDGNRRILVEIKDAQTVLAKVQDLTQPAFRHSIPFVEKKKG